MDDEPLLGKRALRVCLILAAAAAVAVGTFVVLRTAETGRSGATLTSTPTSNASTAACRVPAVEYGQGTPPADSANNWVPSVTAGFVDCQTGDFTVDPTAPSLGPGDHDLVDIPSEGWTQTATGLAGCSQVVPMVDCGWSPSGQELAYGDDSCAPCAGVPTAGSVHVTDASGDRTITPSGEMDRVLGWTDQGIVVARIRSTSGTTAAGGDSGAFLATAVAASFRDFLVDPGTGTETYIATTDAFAANGDSLWEEADDRAGLVRYDLGSGTLSSWPLPAADTSTTSSRVITLAGFDAAGDPLIVTPTGDLVLLTGPGVGQVLLKSVGTTYAVGSVAPLPGGGLLLMSARTYAPGGEQPFDVDIWSPSSGWANLGARFTVAVPMGPGPYQAWPVFAGPALAS